MNLLLDLTLRGSLVAAAVWLLDMALGASMAARDRRGWWALVPLAFLVAIPLPVIPAAVFRSGALRGLAENSARTFHSVPSAGAFSDNHLSRLLLAVWIAGAALYLVAVAVQTRVALRSWSRLRFSTDPHLLELLEDAKAQLGITAPIGLVISAAVPAPAIMGWLRPRILLPEATVVALTREQLRAVLLHELAHFRALDVPLNWLFTLARAVHWFNPAIHLAARAWRRFQEEAADETALRALAGSPAGAYGETLLAALRPTFASPAPFGALAIGESIHHLKRRLAMINRYPRRSPHRVVALFVLVLLAGAALLRPVRADDADGKQAAVPAMQTWLAEMDAGQYDKSWQDAAPSFQQAVTAAKWTEMANAVRSPLGKCSARKLASAVEQNEVPSPSGPMKGDFVVAQFDTSFENMAYAVETVCSEKTLDGTWKVDGYYIKPK